MTCIVGIAANGKVWMGGDSLASDKITGVQIRHPKVFVKSVPTTDGDPIDMLIGCCGSFRMMQVLEYGFKSPEYDTTREVIEYLATDWVDCLRDVFVKKGVAKKGKEIESFTGSFLLGFRGEIYTVEETYQLIGVESQEATCGTGGDYALGSLYTSRNSRWNPHKRILTALECAAAHNIQTSAPFDIRMV